MYVCTVCTYLFDEGVIISCVVATTTIIIHLFGLALPSHLSIPTSTSLVDGQVNMLRLRKYRALYTSHNQSG